MISSTYTKAGYPKSGSRAGSPDLSMISSSYVVSFVKKASEASSTLDGPTMGKYVYNWKEIQKY